MLPLSGCALNWPRVFSPRQGAGRRNSERGHGLLDTGIAAPLTPKPRAEMLPSSGKAPALPSLFGPNEKTCRKQKNFRQAMTSPANPDHAVTEKTLCLPLEVELPVLS